MTVRELSEAPNMATLYPKALLSGLLPGGGSGESLPGTEIVRRGVRIDPAHLAAYNHVCGFRLSGQLPATYPHILAFSMQMALMTERDFPFPLLGMVHVANRITQRRPIGIDETLTVGVRVENLRPHEKGKQFDVVSEVYPGDDSDTSSPVWTDVSTYLHKGGGLDSASGEKSQQLVAPTANAIWRVPGDIGRRYAEVSGDRNPIHLHPLSARLFGFPFAIAHGMWTKAHALSSFEGKLPDAYTVDVRFKLPVLLPAKTALTTWPSTDGWAFELWHARKPKPHLEGSITFSA